MATVSRDQPRPEGGWGWMVVIGCFVNQMMFEGLVRSYGFVYLALQERFHGSAMATSWIQACFSGLACILGPVVSVLAEKFTCRVVVMTGGAMIGVSLVISSITPNLYLLYFTYSVIGGLGGSLIYSPMFIIVSEYFDLKRGRALGISSIGAAIGTFAIPTLTKFLLDNYGYQGTMMIQGAIMLHHSLAGCLYRPVTPPRNYQTRNVDEIVVDVVGADDVLVTNPELSSIQGKKPLSALPAYLKPKDGARSPKVETKLGKEEESNAEDATLNQELTQSLLNIERPLSALPAHLHTNAFHSDGHLNNQNKANKKKSEYLFPNSVITDMNRSKPTLAESIGMLFESALSLSFEIPHNVKMFAKDTSDAVSNSSKKTLGSLHGSKVKVVANGDSISTSTLAINVDNPMDKSFTEIVQSKMVIFKNVSYLFFCFEIFTLSSTILPNFVFLPPLVKENNLGEKYVSILFAVIGAGGFIGTFVIGIIFDLKRVREHKRLFYAAIGIVHGTATMCMAFAQSFGAMAAAAAVIGLMITSLIGQRANATSHYVSPEHLPFAFGVVTMFQGFGNLVGPCIQGLLKDHFDTYKPCFIFGGLFLISSSVIVIFDYAIRLMVAQKRAKHCQKSVVTS